MTLQCGKEFFVVVQSLSHVWLAWTSASQASLSFTVSWSLLKLMSIEWVMHLPISSSVAHFSSCLQSFPASASFPMSWLFTSGGQSIGNSTSASVLPMNIQSLFPLGLTGLISLLFKGFSRVFNTSVWKREFFGIQPSLWSNISVHDYWKNLTFDYLDLCQQCDVTWMIVLPAFVYWLAPCTYKTVYIPRNV